MLSIEEAQGDLARYARAWLGERMAVTRELAREARRHPSPRAVHDLRTSCRRLREALRLFEGVPGVPALPNLDRRARQAMRTVAWLREADVAERMLGEIAVEPLDEDAEAARSWLARRIARQRKAKAARAGRTLRQRVKKLRRAMPRRSEWLPKPSVTGPRQEDVALAVQRTRQFLADRVEDHRQSVVERIAALPDIVGGGTDATARLHDVRVAIKHWRHAVEIARPSLARNDARALSALLRRLVELGGRAQDLSDLTVRVEARLRKTGKGRRRRKRRLRVLRTVVVATRDEAATTFLVALRELPQAITSVGTRPLRPVPVAKGSATGG